MNYYLVAPLTYIGKDTDSLTYSSDRMIEIGTAVKIPLRNKPVLGVVLNSVDKPDFKTKEIIETYFDKPILTEGMLKVANWISEYYSASPVSVLQTIIPAGFSKKRREITAITKEQLAEAAPKLTDDQAKISKTILADKSNKPHLIFGVTGSGKTEIYMALIDETIKQGKGVIVLVPEISLTPQAFERYQKRFPGKATLLHSYLKETERFANWKQILDGQKQIVIGSRSALFAPFENLGLIVIDEEHETTYKQDRTPRYETAKVAEKIAKESGAKLVMGSATPKVETYFRAKTGELNLHILNNRFVQNEFPETDIVDMRNELKAGNYSIFSERLKAEMDKALSTKKQVILFINRRGMSTFVSCRDCGYVEKCPNCDSSLTFHYNDLDLRCHHCGFSKKPAAVCPKCNSLNIKYFGAGTQKVEAELNKIYNNKYKIGRMDADTTKTRGNHEVLYNNFAQNNTDILIGTQMITKGWDLPNVGLVGIITADTMINFPDYTAAERTFDLLTQVGGRTGRGAEQGKVIIQTYSPDYFAIQSAGKHDYLNFYETEIKNREELGYPPFASLIKIVYNNIVQAEAKTASEKAKKEIETALTNKAIEFSILGPSPAFIPKMNNQFYYQITLKIPANNEQKTIKVVNILNRILKDNWSIDVDPADLL